jgi:hypothetical protein
MASISSPNDFWGGTSFFRKKVTQTDIVFYCQMEYNPLRFASIQKGWPENEAGYAGSANANVGRISSLAFAADR